MIYRWLIFVILCIISVVGLSFALHIELWKAVLALFLHFGLFGMPRLLFDE